MSYVGRNPQKHNYYDQMMKIAAQIQQDGQKGVTHITFEHDDWCGVFKGRHCNCNPVVRYGTPETPKKA